jgi:hypothetical protein
LYRFRTGVLRFFMLQIFVRHSEDCPHAFDRTWEGCDCSKWFSGTADGKVYPRTSLGTRDWKKAQALVEKIYKDEIAPTGGITVAEAVEEWIKAIELREDVEPLKPRTLQRYRLVGARLVAFCQRQGIRHLVKVDGLVIRKLREEWRTDPNRQGEPGITRGTAKLRLRELGLFFTFAMGSRYIRANPLVNDCFKRKGKKKTEDKHITLPLDEEGDANYRKLLAAIPLYFDGTLSRKAGKRFTARRGVLSKRPTHFSAIMELMYETGLRESDAVMFDLDRAQRI